MATRQGRARPRARFICYPGVPRVQHDPRAGHQPLQETRVQAGRERRLAVRPVQRPDGNLARLNPTTSETALHPISYGCMLDGSLMNGSLIKEMEEREGKNAYSDFDERSPRRLAPPGNRASLSPLGRRPPILENLRLEPNDPASDPARRLPTLSASRILLRAILQSRLQLLASSGNGYG